MLVSPFQAWANRLVAGVAEDLGKGSPLLHALQNNWQAARADIMANAPKDIYQVAEETVHARVNAALLQHGLGELTESVPINQRAIRSSIHAPAHQSAGVIRVMDAIEGLLTKGEYRRVQYSKYASPEGLSDDWTSILERKEFRGKGSVWQKVGEDVYKIESNHPWIKPYMGAYLIRLSDTELLIINRLTLPTPLRQVIDGVKSLWNGLRSIATWFQKGPASSLSGVVA